MSLRRARPEAPPDSPVAFHAPLFQDLITGLDATERHVVLDLGTASTGMLALLGRSRCRVEIADLAHFGGIEQLNAAEPGPSLDRVVGGVLPIPLPGNGIGSTPPTALSSAGPGSAAFSCSIPPK